MDLQKLNIFEKRSQFFLDNTFLIFSKPKKFTAFFLLTAFSILLGVSEIKEEISNGNNTFRNIALILVAFGLLSLVLYWFYKRNEQTFQLGNMLRKDLPKQTKIKILAFNLILAAWFASATFLFIFDTAIWIISIIKLFEIALNFVFPSSVTGL